MKAERAEWIAGIMIKARAYVLEHGPKTAAEIAAGIEVPTARLVQAIYGSDELQIVGIDPRRFKQGAKRNLYGLPKVAGTFAGCPAPAAPKASSFMCTRIGKPMAVADCVEGYTDATARLNGSPCCQCRTGATHRARFAGT